MNDALCEISWAGPKKRNIKMGYICEIEESLQGRKRRSGNEIITRNRRSSENLSICQVEYRSRRGKTENIQMGCKQQVACTNNKKQNFQNWKSGKWATQCRPENKFNHSVCRQCCNDSSCFQATDFAKWTRQEWKQILH